MFKIRALKEGKPLHIMTTPQFLNTFSQSSFPGHNLLCELYLHEMACFMDFHSNPVSHIGDIHLRAFSSFVTNHMNWWNASQTLQKNEDNSTLWI